MEDVNSVCLVGRLTADPELRSTSGGTSLCSFRLAFTTSRKNGNQWEDQSNFVAVTVWGSHGESVAKYVKKGHRVVLKGRLQYREWEGDSGKRSALDIVADRVQFIEPPSSNGSSGARQTQPAAQTDDVPF